MAFALLNVTPMVVLFLVFQRYFVQGFVGAASAGARAGSGRLGIPPGRLWLLPATVALALGDGLRWHERPVGAGAGLSQKPSQGDAR